MTNPTAMITQMTSREKEDLEVMTKVETSPVLVENPISAIPHSTPTSKLNTMER